MSLFGSMLHNFGDDQFFGHPNKHMPRSDRSADNLMSPFDVIGGFGFSHVKGTRALANQRSDPVNRRQAAIPFGFGRSVFQDVGGMFAGMERMTNDSNCTMYSSSSVVSYSVGEDGQPKVYHATSSTRTAPGGVKETRKAMSDSTTGVRKMAIGHHLGERAHIVEKSQNKRTGQQDDAEEYINIEDGEEENFNKEWCQKTSNVKWRPHNRQNVAPRSHVSSQSMAITYSPRHDTSRKGDKDVKSRSTAEISNHNRPTENNRTTIVSKQRYGSKSKPV